MPIELPTIPVASLVLDRAVLLPLWKNHNPAMASDERCRIATYPLIPWPIRSTSVLC